MGRTDGRVNAQGEERMTYEEFLDFVRAKCMYETIYDDSDGRTILVIRMLDAYKFLMGGR